MPPTLFPSRLISILALAAIGVQSPARSASGPPQPRIGPEGVVLGEKCTRRTDHIEGVVKIDACDRWYCGRADVNDITVLNPNFARTMACEWRLVGSKCKCVRP